MGLGDLLKGVIENTFAKKLDTPEKVKAIMDNAPPLPKPPLGWEDWIKHVLLGSLVTTGVLTALHAFADGFELDDLWTIAQAMMFAIPGTLVASTWARGNVTLTMLFGGIAAAATALAANLGAHHLTQHDLGLALQNGVAFAANAFLKRPDEQAAFFKDPEPPLQKPDPPA